MVNENEVVMLLLCVGVFIFVISKRHECKRIPHSELILTAFYIFFAAVILTVAEGFFSPVLLNILEHLFYTCSSFIMLIWCGMTFRGNKGDG